MRESSGLFSRFFNLMADKPIRFFAIATVFFGLLFILLVPPFQNPDEFVHFARAYEVSELKTPDRQDRGSVDFMGSQLPASIASTYKLTKLYRPPGDIDLAQARKYSLGQTADALRIPLNKQAVATYETGGSTAYVPVIYALHALAVKLLSVVNAPVIVMLYATRLVGLAIWVVLGILALRVLRPVPRRTALAAVLLLPMFIAQTAGTNTEALLLGTTVLYLAVVARMLYNREQITRNRAILLCALLFVMVIVKPVFLAFGLVLFALTGSRIRQSIRTYMPPVIMIGIPFILYTVWVYLTRNTGDPIFSDAIAISNAKPQEQLGHLIPNVFNFVQPFINTVLLGWGDGIYVSLIGMFGKLDTPLPIFFIVLGYLVMFLAIFGRSDKDTDKKGAQLLNIKVILVTVAAALLYLVGVYLAMYIYSTPPREKVITGVQGRYLLPIVPLFVLLGARKWMVIRDVVFTRVLRILPVIILVVSVIVIYFRYYTKYPQ